MPAVSRPKPVRSRKKEATPLLDRRETFLILCGVALAVALALGFGEIGFGFRNFGAPAQATTEATPIAPDYPRRLIDFSLTDQHNQTVTRHDLAGKLVVVNFIFTSCTVTCPLVNAQMAQVQRRTAGHRDVRLLSITLDPTDDTVPVLNKYAEGFEADPARWSFLTGDPDQVRDLIGTSFLPPDTTGEYGYMPGNFANSQRIAVVDRTGKIVCFFDGLNQTAADGVLAELDKLQRP